MTKEEKEYLDKVTQGAKDGELIRMAWWGIFNKKKYNKLFELLNKGMYWIFAYKQAKELK